MKRPTKQERVLRFLEKRTGHTTSRIIANRLRMTYQQFDSARSHLVKKGLMNYSVERGWHAVRAGRGQ